MNNSLSSRNLEVKYAGVAIEYGTLPLLLDTIIQQPVLVMPLERTFQQGSLTVHQWIIHVTTRIDTHSPISYASFWAAEVVERPMGYTLTVPLTQRGGDIMQRAQQFHQQLLTCVIDLLKRNPQISQVIVPARHRLPDAWIWSARCSDERIMCRDGAWVLIER